MFFPTYEYQYGARMKVEASCPLCRKGDSLVLQKRTAQVKLNGWFPLGTYREVQASCPACDKEFLIAPDLSRALLPGKLEKRLFFGAWLALPIPVLNACLMGWALQRSPATSNYIRSWTKIGLVPSTLVTLGFMAYLLSL